MISIAGGLKPGGVVNIERKFYQQLIVGNPVQVTQMDDETDQAIVEAQKLEIEQLAIRQRLSKQQHQKQVYQAISSQLESTITDAMAHQFSDVNALLKKSRVTASQWALLEKLQQSKLNINQLLIFIEDITWLKQDLINLVNSPAFRHNRSQGADVQVNDLKLVMNYIGLEQVRMLIPYYCMRSWLPRKHRATTLMTRKIWRFANVASIAAKALAELHKQDPSLIFTICLARYMGETLVIDRCSHVFDSIKGEWLRQAKSDRDKLVYDAILATPFPKQAICDNVIEYGTVLNSKMMKELGFDDSIFGRYLTEMDQSLTFNELTLESAVVTKALAFAKLLMLQEQHLLTPKEKRLMFDYYEISTEELALLRTQNYRKQELF